MDKFCTIKSSKFFQSTLANLASSDHQRGEGAAESSLQSSWEPEYDFAIQYFYKMIFVESELARKQSTAVALLIKLLKHNTWKIVSFGGGAGGRGREWGYFCVHALFPLFTFDTLGNATKIVLMGHGAFFGGFFWQSAKVDRSKNQLQHLFCMTETANIHL